MAQKKKKDGRYKKTHQHITSTKDISSLAIREYHKKSSMLAAEIIDKQEVQDREYNGYSFNLNKKNLPRAKRLLREFVTYFLKEIEEPSNGEETYHLNLQLFGITGKNK